jgi:hypothetical protein
VLEGDAEEARGLGLVRLPQDARGARTSSPFSNVVFPTESKTA